MLSRSLLLGAVLGFALAVTPSCGPTQAGPRCLLSNCSGCCDVNGQCQLGDQDFACGKAAAQCLSCARTETCLEHVCQAKGGPVDAGGTGGGTGGGGGSDGGTCGSWNCNGCCDSTGHCRGGNTYTACGIGGASCVSCPTNQTCVNAACQPYQCPTCTESGSGQCVAGNQNTACGNDGGVCQACTGSQTCLNGACVSGVTCSASNCTGCCDGTTCVTSAQSTSRCGNGGATCAACTGTDQCVAGACTAGTGGGTGGGSGGGTGGSTGTCSLTCAGCCDSGGACQPGDQKGACGILGANCKSCSLYCLPVGACL